MALTLGSVSVADDGTVTKSGCAGRLYDALIAIAAAELPGGVQSGSDGVPMKRGQATLATALSGWFFTEITVHITARITADVTGRGLQRTPDPNDPLTPTLEPGEDKFLPLV